MQRKIPFKISARTARLIGRQNFPNADGAIIELVKNSYDADAGVCIVVFDNKYSSSPRVLEIAEYNKLFQEYSLISDFYVLNQATNQYDLVSLDGDDVKESLVEKNEQLQAFFQSKCKIHIIDNGEGMTDEIIEQYWMTIGTQNKEDDFITQKGRIKTGAKGIGRFALDKLGDQAEMVTVPDPNVYPEENQDLTYYWEVNWDDFEGDAKTLDQVDANLIGVEANNYLETIKGLLPEHAVKQSGADADDDDDDALPLENFDTGTSITIKDLRDIWTDRLVRNLSSNLQVLIPPKEERIFKIFLFSTLHPEKYGQVLPSICDDYDYKMIANVGSDGNVDIELFRNEFDIANLPDEFFEREQFSKPNFAKTDFEKPSIKITRTIYELAQGLKDVDSDDILSNLGSFEFVFYFMKGSASQKDREVFHYKYVNAATRKAWFRQFGGIKLFRDNFRVRPYGEVDNPAFDWLQLGERATRSPSSIGQQGRGGWLVRPNQISGIINISRVTNLNFEDTSSRYGLQENRAFSYFTELIIGLLKVFEIDRTIIGRELRSYYDATHVVEKKITEASEAKKRVRRKKAQPKKTQEEKDAETLLDYSETLEEQLEELRDEGSLLRILASNGLVIASFTHELKAIESHLEFRISQVEKYLQPIVDFEKLAHLKKYEDPFVMLSDIQDEDKKLREWLFFSLETLKKDKRRRKNVDLVKYFKDYKETWLMACESRGIEFTIVLPDVEKLKVKFFEAELDSIFNNLLINSMEAFKRPGAPLERKIQLTVQIANTDIHFIYKDSGPGLSKEITDPTSIFEPFVTTKRDPFSGKEIGIGLGMWIVRLFVNDNNGEVKLIDNPNGFGLSISLFDKYHE